MKADYFYLLLDMVSVNGVVKRLYDDDASRRSVYRTIHALSAWLGFNIYDGAKKPMDPRLVLAAKTWELTHNAFETIRATKYSFAATPDTNPTRGNIGHGTKVFIFGEVYEIGGFMRDSKGVWFFTLMSNGAVKASISEEMLKNNGIILQD